MREILIIDDDEVTRELLLLFAAEAGFSASAAESGEQALAQLAAGRIPFGVVADMQMPGLTGAALAAALRSVCGAQTRLLAMSGSALPPAARTGFDGFLHKPFSVLEFGAALREVPALSESTYGSLAAGMPRAQLGELYTMCLDDADRRIGLMRPMAAAGDREGYQQAAHAIKGGCGMVGALELAALAGAMEQDGPAPADGPDGGAGPLDEFLLASARLRRILLAQES